MEFNANAVYHQQFYFVAMGGDIASNYPNSLLSVHSALHNEWGYTSESSFFRI